MSRRSREPLVWALFSAGGMLAALILPALFGLLFLAAPLGWLDMPTYASLAALWRHPLVRIGLLGLLVTALFHWAHRFRYTLYDGLQLYHLDPLVAALTYGVATVLSLVSGWLLLVTL